jgi:hypothetical protein
VGLGLLVGIPCLMVLFVALVGGGLILAAQAIDDRAGCGSVDPTDPANYSTITLVNDTPAAAIIDDCSGAYCRPDELAIRLAPGQRSDADAACGVSGSDMTSWRVRSSDDAVLGYVAVDTPRKHDGLVFRLSRASHDRSTPTPPG